MKNRNVNKSILTLAALTVFALAGPAHAVNIPITAVTINDAINGDRNIPGDVTSFQHESTLVDFTAGGTTYSNFVLVDAAATSDTQFGYGASASAPPGGTDAARFNAAVSDTRIDTAGYGVSATSEFEFASAPLSLFDVLFIFDLGGPETGTQIQLIDAADTLLGDPVALSGLAQIGGSAEENTSGDFPGLLDFNGVAISFDEFNITSGQLSDVDGFRVTSGSDLDLNLAGHANTVLVPTSPGNGTLITGESVHDFSSEFDTARGSVNVVNESGLTLQSPDVWHHGNSSTAQDMWVSGNGDPTPWIEFDLGAEIPLSEIHFWNNNESDAGKNRGAELIDVYVSNTPGTADNNTDDGTWGTKIATFNPSIGPGAADYAGERFDIPDTTGRYVRFDITDNYGDAGLGGFSEVHFYSAVPEPSSFALATLGLLSLGFRRRRGTRQR